MMIKVGIFQRYHGYIRMCMHMICECVYILLCTTSHPCKWHKRCYPDLQLQTLVLTIRQALEEGSVRSPVGGS